TAEPRFADRCAGGEDRGAPDGERQGSRPVAISRHVGAQAGSSIRSAQPAAVPWTGHHPDSRSGAAGADPRSRAGPDPLVFASGQGGRVSSEAVRAREPEVETGWRQARVTPSLAEVYRTVPVEGSSWWRKALAFAGPGYLVAVGYMDPGNWATD